MSYREMVYNLVDHMTEDQLAGLIALMVGSLPNGNPPEEPKKDPEKAKAAFESINKIIHPCPNLKDDYKQEYLDYLDERYGV